MPKLLLRQSKLTILLSLNAVAIVIAGILIAGAIGLTNGLDFRVIATHSDVLKDAAPQGDNLDGTAGLGARTSSGAKVASGISDEPVYGGELWNEKKITMYQTADYDLCIGANLDNIGDMYWQTSNQDVITGFYSTARDWLGYNSNNCKYPMITGTGTTKITAGTYDGEYRDEIEVTVLPPPMDQWKREVLDLVNQERIKNGLSAMVWGDYCADAANVRAEEITTKYSHNRPSGSEWSTACPIPSGGGVSGENIAMGNAAVSPATVVDLWMNSESHRANILNPDFTALSVGFVFQPELQHKTYWSQFFTNY